MLEGEGSVLDKAGTKALQRKCWQELLASKLRKKFRMAELLLELLDEVSE